MATETASSFCTFGNLRLYPVVASDAFIATHKNVSGYSTLKESLESKKVVVSERASGISATGAANSNISRPPNPRPILQGNQANPNVEMLQSARGGEQVNSLFVENFSKDTVFIMAGEVVKGGKQDRVLAQDMILPPNSGKVDIGVFCVEHGRWTYGAENGDGSFAGYGNTSSKTVRAAAIVGKEQSKVWAEVSDITTKNGAQSATGTYNELEKNESFQKNMNAYLEFFNSLPLKDYKIIGMVGVSGDKIIGADLFATPELFRNQYKTLLQSYCTEAITNGKPVAISDKKVQEYFDQFFANESKQEESVTGKGMIFKKDEVKLHITTF